MPFMVREKSHLYQQIQKIQSSSVEKNRETMRRDIWRDNEEDIWREPKCPLTAVCGTEYSRNNPGSGEPMLGMSCGIFAAAPHPTKRIMTKKKVCYWWIFSLNVDFEESCQNILIFHTKSKSLTCYTLFPIFQVELES